MKFRKDVSTGDVILSSKPNDWNDFILALKSIDVPDDFLSKQEREQEHQDRDPFEDRTI